MFLEELVKSKLDQFGTQWTAEVNLQIALQRCTNNRYVQIGNDGEIVFKARRKLTNVSSSVPKSGQARLSLSRRKSRSYRKKVGVLRRKTHSPSWVPEVPQTVVGTVLVSLVVWPVKRSA